MEKKKVELLKRVTEEFQDKLDEINKAMHQCEHVLLQGDGLAEFTQEALKEDNPATFLQVRYKKQCSRNTNMTRQWVGNRPFEYISQYSSEIR